MKKTALMLATLAALCSTHSFAATAPAKTAATPQQNRMKTCAAQYHQKGIAKSQYRSFMSSCLKTHPTTAASTKSSKPVATPVAAPAAPVAPATPSAQ